MLSKIAVRRLRKLADYMDSLPREAAEHFDMKSWLANIGKDSEHGLRSTQQVGIRELSYCGTTACALGWACTIPSFKRAGVRLMHNRRAVVGMVRFKRMVDVKAAENFFDIPPGHGMHLFVFGDPQT